MILYANAYAKINLSLDITSVLPNGYHALNTVMQSVSLCDRVRLQTGTPGLSLRCDAPDVPTDDRNTAFVAAKLFYDAIKKAPETEIEIQKNIPSQAGLGGGSADAAAVLRLLNAAYGLPLSEETLAALALQVGADVPFCLSGGTALCLNVGEVLSPLPHVDADVVLLKPDTGVSTKDAYRKFDTGAPLSHPDNDAVLYYLKAGDAQTALRYAANVFETLAPHEAYPEMLALLRQSGAFYASVSGSGSAVFGLFCRKEDAEAATLAALRKQFFAVCATTKRRSVEIFA